MKYSFRSRLTIPRAKNSPLAKDTRDKVWMKLSCWLVQSTPFVDLQTTPDPLTPRNRPWPNFISLKPGLEGALLQLCASRERYKPREGALTTYCPSP